MKSKVGSTVLIGLLYAQAGFGLLAVGAVVMRDHGSDAARSPSTVQVAAAASTVVR